MDGDLVEGQAANDPRNFNNHWNMNNEYVPLLYYNILGFFFPPFMLRQCKRKDPEAINRFENKDALIFGVRSS